MKRIISALLCLAVLAVAFGTATAFAKSDKVTISREDYEKYQKVELLSEIMDVIDELYYGEYDEEELLEVAAESMLDALGDDYTFYYTQDMMNAPSVKDESDYDYVGLCLASYEGSDRCYVAQALDGSPARNAGICRGDILLRIGSAFEVNADNLDVAKEYLDSFRTQKLKLTVLRDGEEMTFTMHGQKTEANYVESNLLEDGIGYIHLFGFAGKCVEEIEIELEALVEMGAKGIILDLRDNPGGWLEQAQRIGDLFMDEGEICYLRYKDGSEEHCYPTKKGKADVKLVVMTNEFTASAAEVLAGALRDSLGAPIVGRQSYGKGIVQFDVSLPGDHYMQITGAEYLLPNGERVHHVGLQPDVESMLDVDQNGDYVFGSFEDAQLDTAVGIMRNLLY